MMLEIDRLSVSFQRYNGLFSQNLMTRLSDVSLTVAAGEIVALVGHSGAGKSLLAHAILGLLPNNSVMTGDVFFEGNLLDENRFRQLRGRDIALLPQQTTYLDPTANVGDLVRWAAKRGGKPSMIEQRLNGVGLDNTVIELYPHQLSGGMARRVLMAQAMAGGAKLLIADEPTAGLDPDNRDIILDQLRNHADKGGAALLITHDLVSVLSYADRIAILQDGKLCCVAPTSAFSGNGEALTSQYAQSLWRALPQNDFNAYA
ncbi:ATP-binding cassette domain-containing protein [Brucella gallinifaecis]|uniref:Nickel import system ATP-binding protein NikD n=1 Tax=Brucella gallinifaecis TaxID=215590 RepID=A0A502BKX4_9HYPH|nr:ATP-binding cassette domain-containing protein [Brucella gallinifaecis]TPF74319.1 ABC transporter ATP-binding protein [Brucella gallinifaecis]